jgi:alpha-D-ribose 1-methylphosphonate 5-triphosphate synthase subunit PhnG
MPATSENARKDWMAVLAKAHPERLADLMPDLPPHMFLRAPEVGAVMVRGRIGNQSEAFNLGEMTVTRASVQLADGTVGHAWVQGRDRQHATRAAVADALMQTERAADLQSGVLSVLDAEMTAARAVRASKAAATKVDFFTMMRGEDT